MNKIKIAKDYSDTPLGRFPEDGEFNGTRFREEFLRPRLQRTEPLEVDIDDAEGYGSSFLEEAFGGLVRKGYHTADELIKKLKITFKDRDFRVYSDLIWKYVKEAKRE